MHFVSITDAPTGKTRIINASHIIEFVQLTDDKFSVRTTTGSFTTKANIEDMLTLVEKLTGGKRE